MNILTADSLLDELIREFDDYVDKRDVSPTVPGSSTRPIMTSQHPTSHTGSSISHNPSSKSPGVTSTNKPHTSTKNPHTSTNNPHTSHTGGTASHKPSGSPKVTATHKPTSAIPGGTATGQPKTKPSTSNPTGSPTQHRSTLYPPQTYPTEEKIKYYNSTGGHTTSKSAGKSTTPGMEKSSTMTATSKPSVTATQPNPVFPSRVPWVNSPQFTCPVFERILFQYFRGFPKLDDISENTQTTPGEFEPIFKKALSIYENIRKPVLVIDNLVEEVAQAMLARRMRCPATKYQQTLTFVLRREAKRAISSNTESLREQIHSLIQGSKDSRTLANKLATEVAEIVYENLVKSILREEFKGLDIISNNNSH
ncbi:hypothetical protein FSP39_001170 [Pinctada imbricata]|uniref:Uncharacterized protein n=1 Tax=Pinctada imbricata TaxID=66713 RepID=A0AA88XP82_PINIB|nr:hypothetical protein FSP39_001170 [Pinctada imbricata]